MAWIGFALRVLVGGVWIVAGALKLPDPAASVRAVRAYQLLPEAIVPTIGYALPIIELLVGITLVVGLLVRIGALLSAILFVAFIVGISSAWARGLQIDCGCFGGGGFDAQAREKYPWEIARDFGLLFASAWLVWRPRSPWALDNRLLHHGSSDRTPSGEPTR
jgi:uncharacterized membrane protein YphA (DoxX/SURF4 family)